MNWKKLLTILSIGTFALGATVLVAPQTVTATSNNVVEMMHILQSTLGSFTDTSEDTVLGEIFDIQTGLKDKPIIVSDSDEIISGLAEDDDIVITVTSNHAFEVKALYVELREGADLTSSPFPFTEFGIELVDTDLECFVFVDSTLFLHIEVDDIRANNDIEVLNDAFYHDSPDGGIFNHFLPAIPADGQFKCFSRIETSGEIEVTAVVETAQDANFSVDLQDMD